MSSTIRYAYLDALRGWAILGVILVHVWIWTGADSEFINIFSMRGAYGVQLFYMISAFTLLLSFQRLNQQGPISWRNYLIRRFFRIAPLFYLAMCLYGPMWQFVPRYWMPDGIQFWQIIATFTFTQGWHPLSVNAIVPGGWSMSVEMTFYLLFPLLCLIITNLRRAIIFMFIALIAGMVLSHLAFEHYQDLVPEHFSYVVKNFTYIYMPTAQLCIFALGFVVFFLQKQINIEGQGVKCLVSGVILFVVFLMDSPEYLPEFFIFSIAFGLFMIGFSTSRSKLLINPLITQIGRLSYSLYLVHFGVIYLFKTFAFTMFEFENKDVSLVIAFFAVLVVSMIISFVSYHLIEKPGIRFGRMLESSND